MEESQIFQNRMKSSSMNRLMFQNRNQQTYYDKINQFCPFKTIIHAINNNQFQDVNDFLYKYDQEVFKQRDSTGNNLLMIAAQNGNLKMIQLMINLKIQDINEVNHQGESALHLAVKMQLFDCADLLLRNEIDEKIMNKQGMTAWDQLK